MPESYPNGYKTGTVGKGEIARYECFQKACFPGASKGVIVWEWVKAPITTTVAFAASVDQDQAAQNVQPDLGSTLSDLVKLCG